MAKSVKKMIINEAINISFGGLLGAAIDFIASFWCDSSINEPQYNLFSNCAPNEYLPNAVLYSAVTATCAGVLVIYFLNPASYLAGEVRDDNAL